MPFIYWSITFILVSVYYILMALSINCNEKLISQKITVKPEDFKPLVFDEEIIKTYKYPFGQMAREVLAALNETYSKFSI